jgi:hypothetical protein
MECEVTVHYEGLIDSVNAVDTTLVTPHHPTDSNAVDESAAQIAVPVIIPVSLPVSIDDLKSKFMIGDRVRVSVFGGEYWEGYFRGIINDDKVLSLVAHEDAEHPVALIRDGSVVGSYPNAGITVDSIAKIEAA